MVVTGWVVQKIGVSVSMNQLVSMAVNVSVRYSSRNAKEDETIKVRAVSKWVNCIVNHKRLRLTLNLYIHFWQFKK